MVTSVENPNCSLMDVDMDILNRPSQNGHGNQFDTLPTEEPNVDTTATPMADKNERRTRNRMTTPAPEKLNKKRQENDAAPPMAPDELYSHLTDMFPSRNNEIRTILGLLGDAHDPMVPLFVYGGASTGKTTILLEMFKRLKRPFAYTSCRSSHTPRILFESILNQLLGHTRCSSNNYSSAKKCDKLGDFVTLLPDACSSAISAFNKAMDRKSHSKDLNKDASPPPVVYLIFDNVEILLDWASGYRIYSALIRLSEFCKLDNLGLIFVSSLGPDAFFSGTGTLEPIPIFMKDYSDDDLYQILLKRKPKADLYSSFLSAVLKPFSRVTRRVTELAEALEPLFQKYIEPIRTGAVKPDEQGKRRLFTLIQPHVTSALSQICGFAAASFSQHPALSSVGQYRNTVDNTDADFHLSLCSKYLLVSAFICSRNPATLDATLFDSTGGGGKKRRKKSAQTTIEKKEIERQEKLLKGPGTFPLERLLAIFCCISAEFVEDEDENDVGIMTSAEAKHGVEMSSDVLMQLSTLVNANLLYKGSSDPLEAAPRYRCNANEELVQMVARSINFPLTRYLYRM